MPYKNMPTRPLTIASFVALSNPCLVALTGSPFGPFLVKSFTSNETAVDRLTAVDFDAVLIDGDSVDRDGEGTGMEGGRSEASPATQRKRIDALATLAAQTATLIVTHDRSAPAVLAWLHRGVQDVLAPDELVAVSLDARIRAAIERKRLEREARTAYATDLDTGLPHQQQLIEHMSHLLALREREPAPMAVLALRIEGLATVEARFGRETAHVLRRRVAVRLRAGVRASDVVAALGDDSFAVLLGALLSADDAQHVGAKLMIALMKPFAVAGSEVTVAAAIGIGQYPQDGTQPDALLRRAVGLAAATQAQGRAGFANFVEAGGTAPSAANDE